MSNTAAPALVLNGMESIRLLCAFQALQMPSRFYKITHRQARDIIEGVTGTRPKGKPPKGTSGLESYLSWHLGGKVTEGALA